MLSFGRFYRDVYRDGIRFIVGEEALEIDTFDIVSIVMFDNIARIQQAGRRGEALDKGGGYRIPAVGVC